MKTASVYDIIHLKFEMNSDIMLEKRFEELYNRAYERGYNTFSPFLTLPEQSELKKMYLPCVLFGGYDGAQRVVAGFGEDVKNDDFPIACVKIEPLNEKFADELTHRDFLGSLMNLGIKRETVGDIIVDGKCGYVICLENIADYICENLTRVRHTSVVAKLSLIPENTAEKFEVLTVFAASKRLDVIIGAVYNFSRSEASKLIASERVFINSVLTLSASKTVSDNDIITIRGYGRFILSGEVKTTKKGRLVLEIKKYC